MVAAGDKNTDKSKKKRKPVHSKPAIMKYQEATKLADKNSRSITKIIQLLVKF
jgi:hypothetical protein